MLVHTCWLAQGLLRQAVSLATLHAGRQVLGMLCEIRLSIRQSTGARETSLGVMTIGHWRKKEQKLTYRT